MSDGTLNSASEMPGNHPPPTAGAESTGVLRRLKTAVGRYRSARAIIIGYGFFAPGGAWKSAYQYFSHLIANGENAILISRPKRRSTRQMIMAFLVGRRIIFNGLDTFSHTGAILFCLMRSNVVIYLHETKYIFDEFRKQHPVRFALVRRIIGRNPICCVSKEHETFVREHLRAKRAYIVYENITPNASAVFDDSRTNIVMVGSVDFRKGATLFSKVADLAKGRGHDWRFYWIGPAGITTDLYLSENVEWLGLKTNVFPFLEKSSLFFLSSVDDPFPLACLEALSLYVKCVVYRKTGLAEFLSDIPGCAVFDDYQPEASLDSIEKALKTPLDRDRVARINAEISSVDSFVERMDKVFPPS